MKRIAVSVASLLCFVSFSFVMFNFEIAMAAGAKPKAATASANSESAVGVEEKKPEPVPETQAPLASETPVAEPVVKESANSESKKDESSGGRNFGKVGISYGISFPHFTEYGIDYQTMNKMFSFSGILGGKALTMSDAKVNISSMDLRLRWHPFMGSFFLGVGYGKQTIALEASGTYANIATVAKLDIKNNYLMPHMGWFRVWDIGLTMGFDFGVLTPSGVTSTLTTDTPSASPAERTAALASADYLKMKDDTEKMGKTFGSASIPYITLFKIGWLF
jgi:hypothetical protein